MVVPTVLATTASTRARFSGTSSDLVGCCSAITVITLTSMLLTSRDREGAGECLRAATVRERLGWAAPSRSRLVTQRRLLLQRLPGGKGRRGPHLLFDAQQLVVLGQPFAARHRADLD